MARALAIYSIVNQHSNTMLVDRLLIFSCPRRSLSLTRNTSQNHVEYMQDTRVKTMLNIVKIHVGENTSFSFQKEIFYITFMINNLKK
jgi:hypothetical protein